jgi:hypothetical protein
MVQFCDCVIFWGLESPGAAAKLVDVEAVGFCARTPFVDNSWSRMPKEIRLAHCCSQWVPRRDLAGSLADVGSMLASRL